MFSVQTICDYVGRITASRADFSLIFIKYQPICRVIPFFFVSLVSMQYVLPVNLKDLYPSKHNEYTRCCQARNKFVMKTAFYILQVEDGQPISNPIHSQDILDASSYPCPQIFSTSRPNWYQPLRTEVAIT